MPSPYMHTFYLQLITFCYEQIVEFLVLLTSISIHLNLRLKYNLQRMKKASVLKNINCAWLIAWLVAWLIASEKKTFATTQSCLEGLFGSRDLYKYLNIDVKYHYKTTVVIFVVFDIIGAYFLIKIDRIWMPINCSSFQKVNFQKQNPRIWTFIWTFKSLAIFCSQRPG